MLTIEDLNERAKHYEALCVTLEYAAAQVLDMLKLVCRDNSQRDVAHILRVSPQYLNDVLIGRRPINRQLIARILASFQNGNGDKRKLR